MIVAFCIGLIETNLSALEYTWWDASESTIQSFLEGKLWFKEADRHIPSLYEVVEVFCGARSLTEAYK